MVAVNAAGRGAAQGLVLDEVRREVRLDGSVVDLTSSQFALLAELMARPGVAVSSKDLLSAMWGIEWTLDVSSLHVHVCRLRRKLGESGSHPRYIRAVRGFGYRIEPDPGGDGLVLHYDAELVLRAISPHAAFLGWEPEEVLGSFFFPLGLDESSVRAIVSQLIAVGQAQIGGPVHALHRDGFPIAARIDNQIDLDGAGGFAGLRATLYLSLP